MPQDLSDLPLSSTQKPELRASKKDNDRDEHQSPGERCQETRGYRKDKKTKKSKREFLGNTICRGREDLAIILNTARETLKNLTKEMEISHL
jgi:hypothetical protein